MSQNVLESPEFNISQALGRTSIIGFISLVTGKLLLLMKPMNIDISATTDVVMSVITIVLGVIGAFYARERWLLTKENRIGKRLENEKARRELYNDDDNPGEDKG